MTSALKVPHVGWNALDQVRPSRVLAGVPDGAQAYFTHSYVAPVTGACVATTTHGETFASVVEDGLVWGAQFHPEKSAEVGLTVLRNFLGSSSRARARSTMRNVTDPVSFCNRKDHAVQADHRVPRRS